MANKFSGKKLAGKPLGMIALAFSLLYCVSSLQVYRGGRSESEARAELQKALETLPDTTREAQRIQFLHFSGHGFPSDADTINRTARVADDFNKAISILAYEFVDINKDEKQYLFNYDHVSVDAITLKAAFNDTIDQYFYERLLLEKEFQVGDLSFASYRQKMSLMAHAHAEVQPVSETTRDEETFKAQLLVAERQIAQMQMQVDDMKNQIARAERSWSEKWLPIMVSILSALIALSANIIGWRSDRRQTRETELLPLKQQELTQNIILKEQQLRESDRSIIIPTAHELQLYSKPRLPRNSESGKRYKE